MILLMPNQLKEIQNRVKTEYLGYRNVSDPIKKKDVAYHVWGATIKFKYSVILEARHNVAFTVCPIAGMEYATVNGLVTFHNPYGYLPAESYGFLPFEVTNGTPILF